MTTHPLIIWLWYVASSFIGSVKEFKRRKFGTRLVREVGFKNRRSYFAAPFLDVLEELVQSARDDVVCPHVVQFVIESADGSLGIVLRRKIPISADSPQAPVDTTDGMPHGSGELRVEN